MKTVYAVFAVAAVIVGLIGTATLLVLLMASAANSKPHQLRVIKWMTLASAVGGLACAAGGVWLLTVGRPPLVGIRRRLPCDFLLRTHRMGINQKMTSRPNYQ